MVFNPHQLKFKIESLFNYRCMLGKHFNSSDTVRDYIRRLCII